MDVNHLLIRLQCLQELRKAFARLPLPVIHPETTILPVGTSVGGRVKVRTPKGEQWRAGRRGMVRSNEPAMKAGSWGFPESTVAAKSEDED